MIKALISDSNDSSHANVKCLEGPVFKNGLIVYPLPVDNDIFQRKILPFFNESFGTNMAINGAITGLAAVRIHDGADTSLWTASALVGTWDFASSTQAQVGSQSVDATLTVNNDEALFTSPSNLDMNLTNNVTLGIYITSWPTQGTKEVRVRFRASGVDIGNELDVSTYIDNTLFNVWQTVIIPKNDFGLGIQIVNEFVVKTIDIGGQQAPNYFLDEIQVSTSTIGQGPALFRVKPESGEWLYVSRITISMAGPLADSANDNIRLSYDTLLNVSELPVGLTIRTTSSEGVFVFVATRLIDLLKIPGSTMINQGTDGTNTFFVIEVARNLPILLQANKDHCLDIQINDDMSALSHFNIFVEAKSVMVT